MRIAALSIGVSVFCFAGDVLADAACISAYEQAQTLRKDGKLGPAKAQAAACAKAECPALLAKDCAKWLTELEASTPTVVFEARTAAGAERSDVRVKVDGVLVAPQIDGKAVALDPGTRRITFEVDDAAPVEVTVVVREGEKNRRIVGTIAGAPLQQRTATRPIPLAVWVFGGVSLVTLTASVLFAVDGLSKKSDLDACKPACPAADVDSMSRSFTFADVMLGAGITAAGAALFVFFTRPTLTEEASATSATKPSATGALRPFAVPVPGGGSVGLSARF